MADAHEHCVAIAERYERGELSAQIALMEMLIASEDDALVERVLRARTERAPSEAARALWTLFEAERGGCSRIATMLRGQPVLPDRRGSPDEYIASCRALFDMLVTQSPEASVALYSLGNPAILATATEEIVAYLRREGLLGSDARVLDVGCGIGRVTAALAPEVAHVLGIDVSSAMIAAARARCASFGNVVLTLSSGHDFAQVADRSRDLVLFVDSFPYVVQAGDSLVDALFGEAARVLASGGHLVVLNFSYRDDLDGDRRDAEALAARHGFVVVHAGARPFRLWNGVAFVLRRG